jgi:hypothetical protein
MIRLAVANGIERALESPFLDAFEEVGEFFFGSQEGGCRRAKAQKAGAIISSHPH